MATPEQHDRIESAIHAFRTQQPALAREIIASVLIKNPDNAEAWNWACEFSATTAEKMICLHRILAIDGENSAARRYLDQLSAAGEPDQRQPETPPFFADVLTPFEKPPVAINFQSAPVNSPVLWSPDPPKLKR